VTFQRHDEQVFPQPKTDMGLLYFYRTDDISDYSAEAYITCNNDFTVGRVLARSYTYVFCQPGLFCFRAGRGPGKGAWALVESGGTYFFRVDLKPIWKGFFGYGPSLTPVSEEEAMTKMKDLSYVSMERNHQIVDSTPLIKARSKTNTNDYPFCTYDQQVIQKVQFRWYNLIEEQDLQNTAGKVKVHWQLAPDGFVTNVCVKENSGDEMLATVCVKAIQESSPFEALPISLRTLCSNEVRNIDFTFRY
jgi:hypothetical protein